MQTALRQAFAGIRRLRSALPSGRARLAALGLLLVMASGPARANTEQIVTSSDGQRPYLVVTEDDDGASKRQPGIYVADARGAWHPILTGKVLSGRFTHGVLAQLALTQFDQRYASLAVIDGRVTLFNVNTQSTDAKSFAVLGSPEHPFTDILQNAQLVVPDVRSVDDIQVFAAPPTANGQLIVVSIRLPTPALQGDGITFALYVKPGTPRSNQLELAGPPAVIDYKFQMVNALRLLVHEAQGQQGVISRVLLQALSRRNPDDPRALIAWKDELRTKLQQLDGGAETRGLPYFDAVAQRPKLPALLRDQAGALLSQIYQIYDPLTGMDGIVFERASRNREFTPADYVLVGRLNTWPNGSFRLHPSRDVNGVALAYINRELHFIVDGTSPYLLKLSPAVGVLPDALAHHIQAQTVDGKNEYHVLLSTRTGNEKRTQYIYLKQLGASCEVIRQYDLLKEFIPDDQLKARTHTAEGRVLFDTLTAVQPTVDAYRQAFRDTSPLHDLSRTETANTVIQSYLKALEEVEISPVLRHRSFDTRGALANSTALFVYDKDKRVTRTLIGELLKKEGQPTPELFTRLVPQGNPAIPIRVTGVALDAAFQGGANGYRIAVTASFDGQSARDDYFPPVVDELNITVPWSQLAGAQVLHGGKKSGDLVYVLLRFDAAAPGVRTEAPDGGVILAAYRLTHDKKPTPNTLKLERVRFAWLLNRAVSDSELAHRLRRDNAEGKVFFVVDPAADPASPGFKLLDLAAGREVLPNTAAERSKKFVRNEDEERDSASGSGGWGRRSASWEVYSPHRLKDRYPKLFPEAADPNIEPKVRELEKLFPELAPLLNRLSAQNETPQHMVFVVPEYAKTAFLRAAFLMWSDRDRPKQEWSTMSFKLKLLMLDPSKASQEEVLENLEVARNSSANDRTVLFADGKDLVAVNRPAPTGDNAGFTITDPAQPVSERRPLPPHLMYLLGTEGETIDLDAFASRETWHNRLSTFIVATPAELQALQASLDPESRFGIMKRFQVSHRFFHGNWRVWPPGTEYAGQRITALKDQPVSEFEKEVFPSLTGVLSEAADPAKPARHRVVLVPSELKGNVLNLVLARWVHEESTRERWSRKNPNLALYLLDAQKAQSQDDILENLAALRAVPDDSRGVLLADLADIGKLGRSATLGQNPFKLRDYAVAAAAGATTEARIAEAQHSPHLLYLLATEGERLQLDELEARKDHPREASMVLIGTEAEWQAIVKDLTPEGRIGLAERFEIEELPAPSLETRRALLRRILERPEIRGLRYEFDASKIVASGGAPLSQDEAMDAVLAFMVSKCELLAKQSGKEVITTFIQYLNVFAASLVQDETLRRRRVIDRVFVERLFSKVFSMPLNIAVLPPEDPLVRLSSQDAVLDLQAAGYEGPVELKLRVIQALLAQTKVDPVRPIPSSIILFGDTGSGKTHLFKTLVRMLDLKLYDYARPTDNTAQAMIINVGKLRPNGSSQPAAENTGGGPPPLNVPPVTTETMTVEQAIRHLHNFLSSPNGYRGYVLFDDVHLASDEVRAQIVTLLRSLFESNNGMYRVHGANGKPVDIPVRNLSLFMTLNPTDDMQKLMKFRKNGDDVEVVLASLSGNNVPIDRSFLERWSLVMNLSLFPVEAKGPKLRDSVRDAARDTFNNQNHLVVVSPLAVNLVASNFQSENARSFLSRATPELIGRALENFTSTSLSIVVPAANIKPMGDPPVARRTDWGEASGRAGAQIESFIKQNLVAIPVRERVDGQLEFLKILVDTFRTQMLESLIKNVGQDLQFAGSLRAQKSLLAPMLHGVLAHLTSNAYLPPSVLNLDPFDFGARTPEQRAAFRKFLDAQADARRNFFPVRFGDEIGAGGFLAELIDHHAMSQTERNRAHVLSETVDKVLPALQAYLQALLRVGSLQALPAADAWLRGLPPADPTTAGKELGTRLSQLFFEFYEELYQKGLAETTTPERFANMTTYDAVRLYLIVLDKAITKLPWAKTLSFMLGGLELATRDMALGQLQGVQHYIFNSKFSLVRPMTHELVMQMATNSEAFRQWKEETRNRASSEFQQKCSQLLVQPER